MIPNDNTTVKHTVKDSVFKDLFSDPNNVLELYRVFHPDDSSVTIDDIQISTLKSIIVNHLINDLGFFVNKNGKTKLIVLAEEQSYWSPNISYRMLGYLCETLKNYVSETKQDVHSRTRIYLPEIDLYVIYAGDNDAPDVISFKDEFFDGNCPVDLQIKVIKKPGTDSIISQYIGFCKIFNEQHKIYHNTIEAIKKTIQICTEKGFLKDYLAKHSKEVITMMAELFDEEYLRKEHDIAVREDARKEEKRNTALTMLANNEPIDKIALYTGLALETINELKESMKSKELA